jgi:hypothetical protein
MPICLCCGEHVDFEQDCARFFLCAVIGLFVSDSGLNLHQGYDN